MAIDIIIDFTLSCSTGVGDGNVSQTEYCPLIGVQYPVHRGQQLNTHFTRPFPPCGSGSLAGYPLEFSPARIDSRDRTEKRRV